MSGGMCASKQHLLMVSATAGTSARRTMFSRPRYLMLGSRTLMNLPSSDTPADNSMLGCRFQSLHVITNASSCSLSANMTIL